MPDTCRARPSGQNSQRITRRFSQLYHSLLLLCAKEENSDYAGTWRMDPTQSESQSYRAIKHVFRKIKP